MGIAFDFAPDRPEHIDAILNGLDRYNPETTTVFQDYVAQQCEDRTYDCYANLALLKLYQFNPPLARDEPTTNILVKALTVFPSPDFSLCLHLLPPHILSPLSSSSSLPAAGDAPLSEAVQKLAILNTLLSAASYAKFWSTLDSDDLYADLIADVSGFEELMRVRIAVTVGQSMRSVERGVLESWLNLQGQEFEHFVGEVCGWGVDDSGVKGRGAVVRIPVNKENEAKGTVVRENVHFEPRTNLVRAATPCGTQSSLTKQFSHHSAKLVVEAMLLFVYYLLMTLSSSKPVHIPSKLLVENLTLAAPPSNTTIVSTPWRPAPWRYRIQRDLYIVFTSYTEPTDPDDSAKILSSFQEFTQDVSSQGHPTDPMQYHGAVFGELVVDLLPYKYHPAPARVTFSLVLGVVQAIMHARGPRLFRSKLEFGNVKVANFDLGRYTPAPHVTLEE